MITGLAWSVLPTLAIAPTHLLTHSEHNNDTTTQRHRYSFSQLCHADDAYAPRSSQSVLHEGTVSASHLESTSYLHFTRKPEHTMPEKSEKIWRKKKHDTRANTPSQPKPVTPGPDEDKKERWRRQPPEKLSKLEKNIWRKTIHIPRPETPVEVIASSSSIGSAPLDEDVEDNRSDLGSEASACTPRRRSAPRPALSRYFSEYLSLVAKEQPMFSQPWNDDFPSAFVTPVSLISEQRNSSISRSILPASCNRIIKFSLATIMVLRRLHQLCSTISLHGSH